MKKILYLFAFICCLFSLASCTNSAKSNSLKEEDLVDYNYKLDEEGYKIISIKNAEATKVEIPNGIVEICNGAFSNHKNLESVSIPKSVTKIGSNPFCGCKKIDEIIVDKKNPVYDSRNNCNAIIETETNTLISGCKSTVIPEDIITIGERAFYGLDLEEAIIPNGVKNLEDSSFSCYETLKKIKIPASVEMINNAFIECMYIEEIVVDSNNTNYDSRNNCNAIIETKTNTLIRGCINTVIPDDITTIGNNAFSGCKNKKEIVLPNTITSIKNGAFSNTDFESIVLPTGIKEIETNVFVSTKLKSLDIPEGVTRIQANSISFNRNLVSVTLPSTLEEIEVYAFNGCTSLSTKYYNGSSADFGKIIIGRDNDEIRSAKLVCKA